MFSVRFRQIFYIIRGKPDRHIYAWTKFVVPDATVRLAGFFKNNFHIINPELEFPAGLVEEEFHGPPGSLLARFPRTDYIARGRDASVLGTHAEFLSANVEGGFGQQSGETQMMLILWVL